MKYRVLLTGNNRSIIDDFFQTLTDSFECLTSSSRYEDLMNHARLIEPDVIVYCLNNETRETISQTVALKHHLKNDILIAIIGDDDECDEFTKIAVNSADLILKKPITANAIEQRITKLINAKREEQRQLELEQKKREEELKALEEANRRKHVLVIDDDIRMLKVIKEQLHEKYDVATALTGKLGLKFLEAKKVDLILLDYEMPNENGPQVLTKIRENEALANIPVLFLTGVTERDKIANALSMKPQGYMLKPIDHDKLMSTLASFLG